MPGSLTLSQISTNELRDLNDNVMMSDGVLSANIKFPHGTTAQRPAAAAIGDIRINTDFNILEYYNGIGWVNSKNSYNPVQGDLIFELDAKHPDSYSAIHDSSNVRWKNLRDNNLSAVSNGGPTYNATDRYFNFDGNDTFSLSSIVSGYPFTVTVWFTTDSWDPVGFNQILNMSIGGQRVSLGITDSWVAEGEIALMYGGTNHWGTGYNSSTMTANTWHNITWVVYGSNNTNHKIYLNNVSQTMNNRGGAHGGAAGWNLGSNSASAEYWEGKISYLAIYGNTLSSAQVGNIYNSMVGMYS